VPDVPSKTNCPISFVSPRSGFARRSSICIPTTWLACLLLAIVHLTGCGVTYNTLPLTVSPSSLSFGAVPIGKTQATAVTLQNPGLSSVTLSGMQAADPAFKVTSDQMNATIPAGGTATIQVTFAPTEAKSYSSQVTVTSGSQQTGISVSGTGQQAAPTSPAPTSPALQVSATTLQFGSVPIGGNAQQSLTLTSSGNAPLEISALNTAGDSFSAQMPSLPLTLQPGQTFTLPVKFDPKSSGAETGQLVIASNAAAAPSVTVALMGSATAPTPPPPVAGTPALTLSSTTLDFGAVNVGAQASHSVTLTSSGTAAVVVQSLDVSGSGFTIGQLQLPLTLVPGQQVALPVKFVPSQAGAVQGQIALADNATGSPSAIDLSGTGTTSPSLTAPTDVDFGDVTTGSQGSKTITLVSNGTGPVTVTSITLVGAEFTGSPMVLPQVLQPNQQMSLKLKFEPTADGDAAGTVTVASNSSSSPTTLVKIHGKGVPAKKPSLSASATSLSFGNVPMGSKATKNLTVTSTGTAPASITAGSITGSGYTASYAGVPVQNLSAPITLQPGQQVTFSVAFDPTTTNAVSGQLSLATDTGSPISVSLTGVGVQDTSPALTASAPSLDFGNVQVGSKAVRQLTLTSSGTAPVTISSSTVAGQDYQISSVTYPSGISGWPATLNPGQQVVLSITFAPDSTNSFTGSVALTSNANGGTANIPLSGTGEAVPTPNLTLSATSISFGQTQIGSKVSRTLTLTSTGNAPLSINTVTVSGAPFSLGILSLPATLQPNQQLTLTVTYDPTTEGSDAGTLTIVSNDATGTATVSLGGSGTSVPAPQLTISPTAVNFGNVPINVASTQSVTLTSTGTAPVTINAATASGLPFSVSGATLPLTLNPNQSATLQVQFDPTASGAATGQMTISSNSTSGATANLQLTGTGIASTTPTLTVSTNSLSFGNVAVNSAATLPLTLTSSGTAPVTISAATLTGTGFTDSGTTFPLTLNPNQSVTLQVDFSPAAAGAATGQLTLNSNSTTGAITIQLAGTGTVTTSPQLTVSTNSLSFGSVAVNSTATLPLTLTSSGTAPVTISASTLSGTGFTDSGASFPVTLNPSQTVTLQLKFNPTAAGVATGQLTLNSNSSTGPITIPMTGTGTQTTSPQLTVSTYSLSFGNVVVNSTATLPLTLTSSGTAPVTISAAALSGTGFTDSGATFPVTLNPNQSVTLQVQFNPATVGAATGQLTITSTSSSGTSTAVQLSGTGTVVTTPQLLFSSKTLSFGNVAVGSTGSASLTLTSSGTAPVTISSAALQGTGFSDSGASFPVTLNPNQSVTITVQFDPTAAGAATGTLTVSSNSTTGAITQVTLSGTGTAVPHEIDLTWDAPSSSADPAVGYNIYRSTNGGGSFTKLNSSLDNQVTYTDSAVQSGTTYTYEIKSVDANGVESTPSNQISLTVP
jgi:Abnormal spindle-like microcephaly-assoc'd, ASPM-SPD-2-Hydin